MTQSETTVDVVDFEPGRWGNPADPMHLSDSVIGALTMLGINEPAPAPADVAIPETRIADAALSALEATGAAVTTDAATRRARMRGFSTPDLLKFREGDGSDAPDVVVAPTDEAQVAAILGVADQHDLSLNPFAGGTTVTGGIMPGRERPVISLDLRRLTGLVAFDEISQIATFAAGTRLPDAERLLGERGFELGHFPQSYEGATVGGCAVTRSAGQSSMGYGRFDDMVVGLTIATPIGLAEIGTAPKSAAGPDLRQLILGSEGAFGVVTTVRVRVHPVPAVRRFYGWHFPDFGSGAAAIRALAQNNVKPTVLRLSDEAETGLNLANPAGAGSASAGPVGGCLMVVGFEGDEADVDCRDAYVTAQLAKLGGTPLGTEPGEHWREGRFRGPYLRDPLLDAGALVETLETVTFWSNLDKLKADVTAAVTGALGDQGTPAVVMCHISHVYPTGASLYFTVIAKALENPLEQWMKAKNAANAAIRAAGAAITHHHAVGTDHRGTYLEEIGDVQQTALRAVKDALDPKGLLNPGILLP
ncbi:FAD-binding oxidoreductase [Gordonia sp. (in: high G+C Gram-positive bacteria)]|uniref:FAD-binding oxidoreductase n=1 Tax=Gordonia sp. (in: high G+C Gram-positive bacteria) TaxID=84139 RepID=UPI001690F7C4|nr:FAD-binding oxidoreductase [Gordonia sp. (in: high G+C Gram-positive bacteria)]NLG47733.1 FAD-binding oxidoreductase [Gordonia sp. (in: high G+C Gram-positive bacteria)]